MKSYFVCPICMEEDGNPIDSFFDSCLNDKDISVYECPKGHKFMIVSRNDKYRIIFDESIIQLQDGFYNNAVLNAYTSLEEFMKFVIKFNLYAKGKKIEEILNVIKIINSSENKKGAFVITLFQDYNIIISKSDMDNFVKLRNQIIHDGKFVNYDISYSYCEKIYNFINTILNELSTKYDENDYVKFDLEFQSYFNEMNNNTKHSVATASSSILNKLGVKDNEPFYKKYESFKITKGYTYKNPLKNKQEYISGGV